MLDEEFLRATKTSQESFGCPVTSTAALVSLVSDVPLMVEVSFLRLDGQLRSRVARRSEV